MRYTYDLNVSASLSAEYLGKICPNADPSSPTTEKAVNDFFQNLIDDFIAGKYISSEEHNESIKRLKSQHETALKTAEYKYLEATSRPYDK